MGIIYSPSGEPRLIPDEEIAGFLKRGYRRQPPNPGGREEMEPASVTPPPNPELVNVNSASLKELTALPMVGTATAKRIQSQRPYTSIEDLIKVAPDVEWISLESKIGF